MDDYPSISDYEDDSSSSSGDDNETETEMEFNCKTNIIIYLILFTWNILAIVAKLNSCFFHL